MERTSIIYSVYAMIIFTIAIFILISISTFSPNDPPFGNYPLNNQVQNYCGKIGAVVSGYLISTVGVTAYVFALLIGTMGVLLFFRRRIEYLWIKILGGILLIATIVPILGILGFETSILKLPPETGGIIGIIAAVSLTEYLGTTGACILLALGFFISIMFVSNKSLEILFNRAFKKIKEMHHNQTLVNQNAGKTVNYDLSSENQHLTEDTYKREKSDKEIEKKVANEPVQSIFVETKPKKRGTIFRKNMFGLFKDDNYTYPPISLLDDLKKHKFDSDEHVTEKANVLQNTLEQFNIIAEVVGIEKGPSVTMYELDLAPGTKLGKISSLSDDIAIALKAPNVRVVAPIQGKSTIGIEVPNTHRKPVQMRELFVTADEDLKKQTIPLLLGKDISGYPLIADLAAMPHLLVAGTTGSGKSVCLNSIILSILLLQHPEKLKLLLIDPKMVEFSSFKDVPHLITPVVTDMKRATAILEWAVNKMDERYALLARAGVRNISGYNKLDEYEKRRRLNPEGDASLEDVSFFLPNMVIVVDELADLMMVASKEVEASIIRLSQKSRAVGIHLIVATQRPSVDVITGLIKSNLPARISFHVFSKVDSRTILDQNGAEKLLGRGDMLFLPPGTSKLTRVQGTYVSEDEVKSVVEYLKQRVLPEFSPELKMWQGSLKGSDGAKDELYDKAVKIILETQRGSVSLLQRRLEIGYSRAARLVDLMAEDGIVGEYKGSQAREVFVTLEEWETQKK
ncbi:MAG: DNA translocase FtsK [Candidatus Scalinduaceae bacterium]